MKKRILSMLLAIVMVVGLLPNVGLTALAADTTAEVKYGASADALTNSGTLAEAITANAEYIQLLEDITSEGTLEFNNLVTIDLNGKTLTATGENYGVNVLGDLTITDSSEAKSGKLSATATGANGNGVYADSSITVTGGSLSGTATGERGVGVFAYAINVSGGTLSGTSAGLYGAWAVNAIEVSGNGSLSGEGTGEGTSGVGVNGNITVTGGILSGTTTAERGNGVYADSSITVTGGSFSGEATGERGVGAVALDSITVSGGTLTGIATGVKGYGVWAEPIITVENEGKLTAMGATAVNIINETGSSYSVKSEETDETTGLTTMVLVKKTDASANSVASVTTAGGVTTNYTDFAEAIAAAKASEGSTLKLLEDISTSKPVYINSGAFTIDLNGKTWTLVKEGLHIYSTADIILTDSSSNGNGKLLGSENYSTLYLYDSAKLDIQRGTMESNSNLTVDMAVFGNSTAELTVSGGKLLANGFNSTAICTRGALVKVTGGTIVSDNNIACYKGVIDLSGHSNPTGITIYNAVSDGLAVSDDTIRLPEGYALLDGAGHAVTTLVMSETYTVGKAPTFYSVEVSAVDAADGFELKGAFVQLLEGQSNVIAEWESGWAPHTIEGLKADVTYTLRAIVAPNGYTLPTDTTFSINTDGTLDNSSVTTTDENGILLIEFVKTAVKVSAVDQANGKDLAGAAMQILDSEGNVVSEWTSIGAAKEIIGLYTGVPYTILPAAAPEGYTIPDAVTFSINEMGDVITSGNTDEDDALLIKFAQTVVRVKAVDAEGAAVEGATVQILNAQGSAVAEWNSAADMESTEDTDESVWEVLGLKAGEDYTLRVAVTPNGYETPGSMSFFLEKYGDVVYADVAVTDNVLMVEFAKAVPKTYTVTLVTNGGIIRDGNVTEYTYGVGAKLPTNVTRSGFYFGGWYDNENCRGTAVTEITAADIGNKTFYAKWNFIYFPIIPSNPTYPPVVNGGDNGDVVVTPKNPEKGDTVTIIPDPDAGYEVDGVIVTDKNGNPMTVVDNGDGTYSFKQPSGKVKIEVTFKEITKVCPRDWTCPMYGYTDLGRSLWYHDGIHYCIEHGLMQGVGNNQFDPDSTTTRAMIVTILWRLEGSPIVNYAMDFEDVAADQWHTEAIRWAASEKIVEGYGNGKFGTNDAITREQMVTIMFRYAKHKGYDVSVGENTNILSYDDAFDVAEWAIPAMQWACGSGMIQGIADGNMMNLAPQGNATRAQAAAILQRFCENATNKD